MCVLFLNNGQIKTNSSSIETYDCHMWCPTRVNSGTFIVSNIPRPFAANF